ncbi:MAG: response regulator transcription factor [Sphingobacterium sp.]|jgi:DNA-binding LytR/AlgR family response regulator|nr:response regulator transcription factor [Sphingobacterium sp.]
MKISCIIVDDEPIARDILKSHLKKLPNFVLIDECINANQAYEALHQYAPDVMFLDIQMPIITGTEFLRSLRNPPLVVFTTAYPDFALIGFDLNSTDYLLKPITFERFLQATEKIHERLLSRIPKLMTKTEKTHIFIKQNSKFVRVNFNDIIYVLAQRDFSVLYLSDNTNKIVGMNIGVVEEMLLEPSFVRVHRSYIVQLEKIHAIMGNILKTDLKDIPIGPNYRERLLTLLNISS